ncbi:hypothetical protein LJC18_00245 [Lachnospiraceae bacterium OttesenSCG-928-E19]|nr:hypothetical protein [Lachnospiraceae bacterium OttesenSCG-928-E19]
MKDNSSINFLKSPLEYPPDYKNSGNMDLSRKSILILGGEITQTSNVAFSYIRTLATTLYVDGITDGLDIYSGYYKFNHRNPTVDRWQLFKKHRENFDYFPPFFREVEIESGILNSKHPNYITDTFNFAIRPRLFSYGNSRFSYTTAKSNIRNLIIYTHCHGAYVQRMLEDHMAESMKHFYSKEEISDIQNQLLVLNHLPFAPSENPKFNALSFGSASDTTVSYYNLFDYKMKSEPHKFQPAFYGPSLGNIMVADKLKFDPDLEHSQVGINWTEAGNKDLTENGKILFTAQRNAFLTGVRSMINEQPMPEISELITTDFADYKSLVKRGLKIQRELGF